MKITFNYMPNNNYILCPTKTSRILLKLCLSYCKVVVGGNKPKPWTGVRRRIGAWLTAIFLLLLVASTQAETQFEVDMPSQPLADSLNQLSSLTQVPMLFSYDLVKHVKATEINGRFSLLAAVQVLLSDSNLIGRFSKKGVLVVTRVPANKEKNNEGEMMNITKKILATAVGLFAGGVLAQADVQDQAAVNTADLGTVLEEVIVTATRRDTGIQTTAISMSAFSGSMLKDFGKTNITEFIDAVPGVTSQPNGGGGNRIVFRNIATSTQEAGSPTSATYLDDFALDNPLGGSPEIRLVDMERVEVLKGPQGTLFGRSAMGGIVRYISNKPNTEAVESGFNGYISNTADGGNNFGGYGYLNLPIADDLAVRLVAYSYQDEGFIDNVELGESNANHQDTVGGRLALHWAATENFSVDLNYLKQITEGAYSIVTTTRDPGDLNVAGDEGPDIPFDIDKRTMIAGTASKNEPDYSLLNLSLNYDFEAFKATFLATRIETELGVQGEQRELVALRSGTSADRSSSGDVGFPQSRTESDVVELRLVSSGDGFLDWIAGLYYEESTDDYQQLIVYSGPDNLALGFLPLKDGDVAVDSAGQTNGSEIAAYGELGFNFSSNTRLLLGYRRSDIETATLSTKGAGFFDALNGSALLVGSPFATQEDVNTYKVSLEHSFNEDTFGYALASSGYRRGGFNRPVGGSPFSTYDSDTLWNYELGLKSTLLEGRLVANAATFVLQYDDIQLAVQDPVTLYKSTQNVGKADIYGLELGLQYQLNENFRLGFSGYFSDPKLKEDVPGGQSGKKGDALPGSATESFSFTVNYDRPLSNDINLSASLFYRYVGDRLNDFNRDLDIKLPSYSIADVRLGVSHAAGWRANLFADNIFDEAVIYSIDRQGPFFEAVPTNRPRTIGLSVSYDY